MKRSVKLPALLLTTLALCTFFCSAKKKTDDPRLVAAVANAVREGNFKIQMTSAISMTGVTVDADNYDLTVKDGKANTRLPYIGGGGANAAYGTDGDNSIVLNDYPVELEVDDSKAVKKGRYTIRFKAKSGSETVDFSIRIFTNGSADLSIQPTSRGSMSYFGFLVFE